MEGAIHIPRRLQKKILNIQPRDDREEETIYEYLPAL